MIIGDKFINGVIIHILYELVIITVDILQMQSTVPIYNMSTCWLIFYSVPVVADQIQNPFMQVSLFKISLLRKIGILLVAFNYC